MDRERANWVGRGIAKDGYLFSRIVDRWNDDIWLDMADTADDLSEALDAHLIGPLADALVWGTDVDRMGETVAGLYRVPLFYAIGFALLGREENLELLLPILRQLEHVVIVGERRGMRDSWVVLIK